MNHSEIRKFFAFSNSSDFGFESKIIFCFVQFLVHILPLGTESVDPDPGSKNLTDPANPGPKHCITEMVEILTKICNNKSTKKGDNIL